MNKKSQFFSILLVFGVIAILIYAWSAFDRKQTAFKSEIGDKQLQLLQNYSDAEKEIFYVETASMYAGYQSVYEIGQLGGFYEKPICDEWDGWTLWTNTKRECYPTVSDARKGTSLLMKKIFNRYSYGKLIADSFDFVFIDKEVDVKEASFDSLPVKEVDLAKLENEASVKDSEGKDIITWTKNGDIVSLKDLRDNKEYSIDIKNKRWSGKATKLHINGVAGINFGYNIYCSATGCGKYVVKPDTTTQIDYSLGNYEAISREAKKIKERCEKEQDTKACVTEEVISRGWTMDYCPSFSPTEECMAKNLADKKYYYGETIFPGDIIAEPILECKECPSNKNCRVYLDERDCMIDSCGFSCFARKNEDGNYVQCENKMECELINDKEQCSYIGSGCSWVVDSCKKNLGSIDTERTFKICASGKTKYFVYDKESMKAKEMPISIRFAMNIPDKIPPEPIERLTVKDKDVAEDSVIIRWDKSKASDISHYLIYYKEVGTNGDVLLEMKEAIKKGLITPIFVEGRDKTDWGGFISVDENQVEREKVAKYKAELNDGFDFYELEKNKAYLDNKADELLYVLDVKKYDEDEKLADPSAKTSYDEFVDDKKYAIAIVPVDIYGNVNENIKVIAEDKKKGDGNDWPVDDLAPGVVDGISASYTSVPLGGGMEIKKVKMSWNDVTKNIDGSKNDDIAEYSIYKIESICALIEAEKNGKFGSLLLVEKTKEKEVELEGTKLDLTKCHYLTVIASDDKGNYYYGDETKWVGINIPGAS